MADTIKCPHCDCKVKLSDVENEEGRCPECGDYIVASSFQNDFGSGIIDEADDYYANGLGTDSTDDDNWDPDDTDESEPDILDELNDDFDAIDEDGAPRKSGRRSSGLGFQSPQASPRTRAPRASKGKKK